MANKPLKSIKFPGLADTYTVPEIDNTLTTSGKAADAKKVGDELGNLKSAVETSTGNAPIAYTVDNAYYNTSTVGSTVSGTTASNNFEAAMISCSPGDKFTINGTGGATGRLWAFLDSSDKVIVRETSTSAITGKLITAPANAAKLVINNQKSSNPDAVSVYGETIDARLVNHQTYTDGKFDTAVFKRIYLQFVSNSYVKTNGHTGDYNGWKRTTFVSCDGLNYLYIYTTTASTYNSFYTDDDEDAALEAFSLAVGMNTIPVPATAKYYMLSNTDAGMDNTYVLTQFEHNRQLEEKNNYLRVCTFNIARSWTPFVVYSDADYTAWQVAQFLNIYGKINADIMCQQEALGTWNSEESKYEPGQYVDAAGTVGMYSATMQNKYDHNIYIPNDDMRTVSKFVCISTYRENYPTQYSSGNRKYERLILDVYGKRVAVFNTHLEYHGDFDDYQGPQVEYLCDKMLATLSNGLADYAIACGDMNTWDEAAFRTTVEAKGLTVANGGAFGIKTTWGWKNYVDNNDLITDPDNPTGPKIPKVWDMNGMDNIIVSSNISIQNAEALEIYEPKHKDPTSTSGWPIWEDGEPVAISDHYPFFADLRLD